MSYYPDYDSISVTNRCDECNDGHHIALHENAVSLVFIHRVGVEIGTDAVSVSKWYQTTGKEHTGGQMPYTFVNTQYRVEQALPLMERGVHAKAFGNMHGIGFAQVGDFNKHLPPHEQWQRAAKFCAMLIPFLARHTSHAMWYLPSYLRYTIPVVGHGEVPATFLAGSGKEQPHGKWACPGSHWDMELFRQQVQKELSTQTKERLHAFGVQVER